MIEILSDKVLEETAEETKENKQTGTIWSWACDSFDARDGEEDESSTPTAGLWPARLTWATRPSRGLSSRMKTVWSNS